MGVDTYPLNGGLRRMNILRSISRKHKTNKGCIHIKSLDDIDEKVLAEMIDAHIKHVKSLYPEQN